MVSGLIYSGEDHVKRRHCSPGGNVLASDDGQQLATNRQELTQRTETFDTREHGKSSREVLKA